MYSRYIPPPKGGSNSLDTEPTVVASQPSQTLSKSQPTTYARYVPPPKTSQPTSFNTAASQHVRFDEEEGTNRAEPPAKRVKLVQDDASAQNSDQERSKKLRKKKRKSIKASAQYDNTDRINGVIGALGVQTGEERDEANASDGTETLQTLEGLAQQTRDSPLPTDKKAEKSGKRKDRKKKKKIEDANQTLDQTEDNIPLRFQAVLNKKAKSYTKTHRTPARRYYCGWYDSSGRRRVIPAGGTRD
ncbi:hypothetical protein RRF57_008271 [Xylaria bambusicola]|uniref:Uncharacterized protein n=1 Tax=Xylaria bambusicola TaxID=326684 RepID=A0AAN7Z848_9PEZI